MKLTLVILSLFITSLAWAQTDSIPPVKKEIDFVKRLSEADSITGGKVIIHADPKIEQLLKLSSFKGTASKSYPVVHTAQTSTR